MKNAGQLKVAEQKDEKESAVCSRSSQKLSKHNRWHKMVEQELEATAVRVVIHGSEADS